MTTQTLALTLAAEAGAIADATTNIDVKLTLTLNADAADDLPSPHSLSHPLPSPPPPLAIPSKPRTLTPTLNADATDDLPSPHFLSPPLPSPAPPSQSPRNRASEQNMLHGDLLSRGGLLKMDPSLKAHSAVLRLFAALLECQRHRASGLRGDSSSGAASASASASASVSVSVPARRVPDLQDPLLLIGRLRACWRECAGVDEKGGGNSAHGRALGHLRVAKDLLEQAAKGLPRNASLAGYRAATEAAESGWVSALRQLECFVERNPGSVKGRSLHARLLEMSERDARAQLRAKRQPVGEQEGRRGGGDGGGEGGEGDGGGEESCDGLRLVGVARARALRGWLETDPLEPRAVLGLASLHAGRSGAALGVADRGFVAQSLAEQLETHGFPRAYASTGRASERGALHTSRAALALWGALADLLGPLRVRDEPVLLPRDGAGKVMMPPRPGTVWDHIYGMDPPWAPTDFQRRGGGGGWDRGEGEWRGEAGRGLPGPPTPHPLLGGLDKELWDDVVLDPGGDPLLAAVSAVRAAAVPRRQKGTEEDGEVWCSDDEDCVLDDETEALEEGARLASKGTGGLLYYPSPAVEEGLDFGSGTGGGGEGRTWQSLMTGARPTMTPDDPAERDRVAASAEKNEALPEGGGGGGGEGEGGGGVAAAAAPKREFVLGETREGAASGAGRRPKKRVREEVDTTPVGNKRMGGRGGAVRTEGGREEGPLRGDFRQRVRNGRRVKGEETQSEGDGEGDEEDADADDDEEEGAGVLREAGAPLAAVWLLADKCSVAAQLFGPQHRYCLRAINRLCRQDVREVARPVRAALRRRGFRLQLSLLRAAANDARAAAAAADGEEGAAWGLPTFPGQKAVPLDSYVPERVQPLVGLLSPRWSRGDDGGSARGGDAE
eukprot:jgi/Undpi1/13461/HiC_scaffold_8.g03120.m1